MRAEVEHVVRVTSAPERISLSIGGTEIQFEVPDFVEPSCDFAIWAALPLAMRRGGALRIEGPTSPIARRNAERLSIIWSTFVPEIFRPVRLVDGDHAEPPPPRDRRDLMLYSGGVDSTYALRRRVAEGGARPDLLTIQGMDYKRTDDDRFRRLNDKTLAFRRAHGAQTFTIRSNAASVMRRFGVSADIGHGFHLFSALFLFDATHATGLIAADDSLSQEMLSYPWGTNHVTNALFAGDRMSITSLSNDVTRGQKIAALTDDPLALGALSFCKNYAVRPDNCGVCTKCVRTKAMIRAAGKEMPDIFRIRDFHPADLRFVDVTKNYEVSYCLDVLALADRSGQAAEFEFLRELLLRGDRPSRLGRLYRKGEAYLKGRFARTGPDA